MTKEEIQNNYPKTWKQFSKWFEREGWGANSADCLSQRGVNEWFPDFSEDYGIDNIEEYENSLEENTEQW